MLIYYDEKVAAVEKIETFLAELRITTGASQLFLDAARPAVERIFTSTPKESRHEAMVSIRKTVQLQAATESSVVRAIALASMDEIESPAKMKEIRDTQRKLHLTRGIVVSSILNSYGGFGGHDSVNG